MPVDSARDALPLWVASIPDPFTPAQGLAAAKAALADADAVVGNIRSKFQGTLPPEWPKTAALSKAIDDVEIARDAMAALDEHTDDGRIKVSWPKTSGKFGPALVRAGSTLYAQLADLEGKAATSESLPDFMHKIAPTLPNVPNPFAGLTTLLLVGVAFMAVREFRSVRRLIEGS